MRLRAERLESLGTPRGVSETGNRGGVLLAPQGSSATWIRLLVCAKGLRYSCFGGFLTVLILLPVRAVFVMGYDAGDSKERRALGKSIGKPQNPRLTCLVRPLGGPVTARYVVLEGRCRKETSNLWGRNKPSFSRIVRLRSSFTEGAEREWIVLRMGHDATVHEHHGCPRSTRRESDSTPTRPIQETYLTASRQPRGGQRWATPYTPIRGLAIDKGNRQAVLLFKRRSRPFAR